MIYALVIILPPLALLLKGRLLHALLNVPLTLLFWLPGIVHAWAVISRDERDERDARLAVMMRGVPAPAPERRGALPAWLGVLAVAAALGVAGVTVLTGVKNADSIGVSYNRASPARALPLPEAGATYAEIEAAYGPPVTRDKATGWAVWSGWSGRFEAGRLMETRRAGP